MVQKCYVWQCLERLQSVVTHLMVTYDGVPGELMIGIIEEHLVNL